MTRSRTAADRGGRPANARPVAPGPPPPSGPYPVGRLALELVDRERREVYASEPDAHRELVLWVWYPAGAGPDRPKAAYLPSAWAPVGDFLGIDVDGLPTSAVADAPLAGDRSAYPVLLMSPSGFSPLLLTAIAQELASLGYVVVGVNHTYESAVTPFADGRIVPFDPAAVAGVLGPQTGPYEEAFRQRSVVCEYKAADLASVADHLGRLPVGATGLGAERLDLNRLGAFGHSFGGNAALEWCRTDHRCRAAANLDGGLWTAVGRHGVPRPVLQLLADHPEFALSGPDPVAAGRATSADWYDAERRTVLNGWRRVDEAARPGYTLRLAGATHLSFMDLPFLPSRPGAPFLAMLGTTTIGAARAWRFTCGALHAFFARHLLDAAVAGLEVPSAAYPEVAFGPP